ATLGYRLACGFGNRLNGFFGHGGKSCSASCLISRAQGPISNHSATRHDLHRRPAKGGDDIDLLLSSLFARMFVGGCRVLVSLFAMFVSRFGVLLRLFVLAKIMMMGGLMMMMCGRVVMCTPARSTRGAGWRWQ
ncbi:hypothetical protein, partial [Roseiarcus sp.]|uniref:hypothetical protein n=1 Tax=Roseiarcus sp. TaxID=1969460 RepID=UPI003C455102